MRLSLSEQKLLDFAREEFGDKLTTFLMVGLGENVIAQRWRFIITYAGDDGTPLKRRVDVSSHEPFDGTSCLPRRRDPLVITALLCLLLRSKHVSINQLHYTQEEVLNLLGWHKTSEVCSEIDDAIERYFLLSYNWKMSKIELMQQKLRFYSTREVMISEYQILEKDNNGSISILNRIVFSENFINQLLSRSLFGINWNRAWSVEYGRGHK